MNALFAWTYEFGYEILSWSNILRKYQNKFDKIYIASFSGRELLYRGFIDRFIPYPKYFDDLRRDNANLIKELKEYLSLFVDNSFTIYTDNEPENIPDVFDGYEIGWENDYSGDRGAYIDFKHLINTKPYEYFPFLKDKRYIVINPRYAKTHTGIKNGWGTNKNYSFLKWEEFIYKFLLTFENIYVILLINNGNPITKSTRFEHERLIKIYDADVETQVDLLNNAECAIYSQSGATFLTLFCDVPIFSICIQNDYTEETGEGFVLENSIFHKRWKNYRLLKSPTNDINDIDVDLFFNDFVDFYKGFK